MTIAKLHQLLDVLKFEGMTQVIDQLIADAEKNATSTSQVIADLLEQELRYRKERSLINRIKNAAMPHDWSLTTFPFSRQPAVDKRQIMDLANIDFIRRGESIVLIGPPGTGKTGLAIGLLREALVSGCRGRFYNVQDLLNDMYASLADRSTPKLLKHLSRFDILVLDELGYLTLNAEQSNAFFKLMAERYQAGKPTIITTNLDYPDWYSLFDTKNMLDALLDRLQHRCVTIHIKGQSLRKKRE
jgi:DNA replication protein DnaC